MTAPETKRPNFLVIVCDDLGFSDPGCFGGEIQTPVLDKLAKEGLRFTEYHSASMCSPTRSMIMSGTDHHIAGIGAMVEEQKMEFGARWRGKPGYEGYLVPEVASLPEVLQGAGYHTIMSGKWHLGNKLDQIPGARGFDRSFSMLSAFHNHYAWEPQWEKGDPHDDYIADWHPGWYTKENTYSRDQNYDNTVVANHPKKEGGFYSSITFTDELLGYLKERQDTPELKEKPFFVYYPFTAPHYPLQADKKIRDKYLGIYNDGPNALREKRLKQLQKMGLIDADINPHEVVDMWGKGDWESYNDEEKAKSCRAMEVFAAMVDIVDQQIGRVIDQLEKDGELDNTFVLFMSDNGAEGASYEAIPVVGEHFMKPLYKHYNNTLENIGEPDSFVWYGQNWAQASTAPSRLFKAWTSEGGIRVPCLVRYPPMHKNTELKQGSIISEFQTCMDIMPTLLDLAGVTHPAANGPALYKGRKVVPMRGKSWVPWMYGEAKHIHDTVAIPAGWELHGRAAIRQGDYKILFMPPPGGKGTWELFDLKKDPGETRDLSKEMPEKMEAMLKEWYIWMNSTQVVWKGDNPYIDGVRDEEDHKDFTEGDEMDDPRSWMKMDGGKTKAPGYN